MDQPLKKLAITFRTVNTLLGKANNSKPSITKTNANPTNISCIIVINYFLPSVSPKYSKKSPLGDNTIVVSPSVNALL